MADNMDKGLEKANKDLATFESPSTDEAIAIIAGALRWELDNRNAFFPKIEQRIDNGDGTYTYVFERRP